LTYHPPAVGFCRRQCNVCFDAVCRATGLIVTACHGEQAVNSLRPLATISLLGIVGLFLYMKINETEPVIPPDAAEWGDLETLGNIDIGGAGDIANVDIGGTPGDAAQSSSTAAPPYGEIADTTASAPPSYESAAGTAIQAPPPFVPQVVEQATDTTPAPKTEDRYSQAAMPTTTGSDTKPGDSKLPPLPALPAAAAMGAAAGVAANEFADQKMPVAESVSNITPAESSLAAPITAPDTATSPAPHVSTPADNTMAATAAPVSNATAAANTTPPFPTTEPTTPTESLEPDKQTTAGQASLFSAARVAVQSALDRGELSQALLLLSDWYGDPSLSPAEATEVQELLSQLAGSVIYSTEHRLEPPYMVQAGEKLSDIAVKHNVPWQLLAKINGITNPDQLQPGQQLKVIRGPFSARIDLSERKLVLMLDRRYAGQFAVDIEPTTSIEEGYWAVNQKLLTPGSVGMTGPTGGTLSEERSILLTSTTGGNGQVTVLRGPGAASPATSDPADRVIQLRGTDVEDVYDILSLGSQIVIRR
jgi:LysM repeat protein